MAVTKRERNRRIAEASHVIAQARANPATRCCECNRTLDQCGPRGDGHNANRSRCTWDAGHPDGRWPTHELRPECSHCNRSRGATDGNRKRNRTHSRRW